MHVCVKRHRAGSFTPKARSIISVCIYHWVAFYCFLLLLVIMLGYCCIRVNFMCRANVSAM